MITAVPVKLLQTVNMDDSWNNMSVVGLQNNGFVAPTMGLGPMIPQNLQTTNV